MIASLALLGLGTSMLQAPGSAGAEAAEPELWQCRVLDAFTAQPLAGVQCEIWTEDMFGPPVRLAEAWSAADGTLAMTRQGTKLVLRRAGYRSTEHGTPPEEEILLFPALEPFTLRVLDLEGLPIAGATVRTRQSCRHAIPAVEARSDGSGMVEIPDLPPFRDEGELEVLASGFGALSQLEPELAWQLSELRLPRRRAPRVRWLYPDGAPIPAGRLRYDSAAGGYPLQPDAEGWVSHDRVFQDRDGVVHWRQSEKRVPVVDLADLPSQGSWTVRFGKPPEEESDSRLALVRVQAPAPVGSSQGIPEVRLLHEQGWLFYGAGEHRVPAGKLHVIVGGPFSGACERVTTIELRAGEPCDVAIAAEPEPELRILVPEDAWWIHVQADDDSITLGSGRAVDGVLVTPVPRAQRVTVLAQGRRARRAILEDVDSDRKVDLRAEEALLVPAGAVRDPRMVELCFLVRAADGSTLEPRASARAAGEKLVDLDPAPERVIWSIPAGARFEACFSVEGFRSLYRSGIAGQGPTSGCEELRLPLDAGAGDPVR